jgi:hypothetical protein
VSIRGKGRTTMSTQDVLKKQVLAKLDELPADALEEVATFLDYLRFKLERRSRQASFSPVSLGGLWKGSSISDEEIADARREMWGRFAEPD